MSNIQSVFNFSAKSQEYLFIALEFLTDCVSGVAIVCVLVSLNQWHLFTSLHLSVDTELRFSPSDTGIQALAFLKSHPTFSFVLLALGSIPQISS